jgi:hypothetical protein
MKRDAGKGGGGVTSRFSIPLKKSDPSLVPGGGLLISAGAHRPFIRFSRRRVETNQVQLVPGQQLP